MFNLFGLNPEPFFKIVRSFRKTMAADLKVKRKTEHAASDDEIHYSSRLLEKIFLKSLYRFSDFEGLSVTVGMHNY